MSHIFSVLGPTHWLEIKRLYGKDYFMPHTGANASVSRAKCLEMGVHPAAITSLDDSKAVREIGRMCMYTLIDNR